MTPAETAALDATQEAARAARVNHETYLAQGWGSATLGKTEAALRDAQEQLRAVVAGIPRWWARPAASIRPPNVGAALARRDADRARAAALVSPRPLAPPTGNRSHTWEPR